MNLSQLFLGFLEPIAIGALIVLGLVLAIRLGTPRRSPVVVDRGPTQ